MKKILVIDDQYEVREFLSDFLSLKGFDVLLAADGQIGLNLFKDEEPDVAIVDVEMPVMNAGQFSQKALAEKSDFPILIITAFLKKYAEEDLMGIGVRNVLPKPIDLHTLHSEIEKALN